MTPEETLAAILACDTDIVIRAGAGTGKTHTLVERYLTELTMNVDGELTRVDQLAALTFTEKAAEEMQERLRSRLTGEIDTRLVDWWEKRGGDPDERPSAANLEERIVPKNDDETVLLHLIRQRQSLAGAYISTIHSFCARLLLENPVGAGVDPGYGGIDETTSSAMLQEAARDEVVDRLRRRDEATTRLARRFGFGDEGRGSGLVPRLAKMIPLLRAADADPEVIARDYETRRETLGSEVEGAGARLASTLDHFRNGSASAKETKVVAAIDALPALTGEAPLSFADALAAQEQAAVLRGILDKPRKKDTPRFLEAAQRAMNALTALSAPIVEAEAAPDVHALLSLAVGVRARYEEAKGRHSLLDFDDLQERGLALLTGSAATLARYRTQFRRVMVDEYQDTNELQRKIVTTLAPPGEGRLLVVGDVKQSIYGFRGADVSVFTRTEKEIDDAGGAVFALRQNRRSAPGALAYFNGLFTHVIGEAYLPTRDDLLPYRPPLADDPPTVERFATAGDTADERRFMEARSLATMIRQQVDGGGWRLYDKEAEGERNARWRDVAILLRTFTSVGVYEAALRHAGVPYTIVKGKGFYDTSEIGDLTAVLRWLLYGGDRLSYLSILRSPFAGLSDTGLLRIVRHGAAAPDLADDDRAGLARFTAMADRWRRLAGRMMVSELIERILADSGYGAATLARLHGEQRLANILKLIEKARTFDRGARGGLGEFLDEVTAAAEGEREPQADLMGEENTVRVMTIHQSKGLEFGVTIIGDVGRSKSDKSGADPILFHPHIGIGVKIFDETTGGWVTPPLFREVADARKRFDEEESGRLLYVAATRARDRLILSGSGNGPWGKSIDATLPLPTKIDPERFPPIPIDADESTPARVREMFDGWIADAPPPPTPPPFRRPDIGLPVTALAAFIRCPRLYYYQQVARHPVDGSDQKPPRGDGQQGGIEGHLMMERMPLIPPPNRQQLTAIVESRFGRQKGARRETLVNDLARAFDAAPLSALAGADEESLFREAGLTFRLKNEQVSLTLTGAVDLLFFADGAWRVIDYKFSRRPADETTYRTQVGLYGLGWSMVGDTDVVTGGIVYLREPGEQGSAVPLDADARAALREEALEAAATLARWQGEPVDAWERVVDQRCASCPFKERCGA